MQFLLLYPHIVNVIIKHQGQWVFLKEYFILARFGLKVSYFFFYMFALFYSESQSNSFILISRGKTWFTKYCSYISHIETSHVLNTYSNV